MLDINNRLDFIPLEPISTIKHRNLLYFMSSAVAAKPRDDL